MADVQVRPCNCKNDFQDATYGKGLRVYNPKFKGGFTCTVCRTSVGGEKKVK